MSRFRLGLARTLTLVGAILFWTWTSAKAAVTLIGASTVGDDFQQLLDRLPLWGEWLFSTPWWVPSSLATALTLFLIWLSWPREIPGGAALVPAAPSSAISSQTRIELPTSNAEPRYLDAAMVSGGIDKQMPEYRARFARSGSNAMFAVEYSVYIGGASGKGWMPSKKINVYFIDRFTRGEGVKFSLIKPAMTDDGMRWYLGNTIGGDSRFSSQLLGGAANYRGRVTLHVGDAPEEHCYFTFDTIEGPHDMPNVIGEHMFDHMQSWEGLPARNGDSASLFG